MRKKLKKVDILGYILLIKLSTELKKQRICRTIYRSMISRICIQYEFLFFFFTNSFETNEEIVYDV